jgi:hypothetical protein
MSINYNHNINLDKVWGQAVYLWETGKETNYLTQEEQTEIQEHNKKYETKDSITLLIENRFDFNNKLRYWMKASDIFTMLGSPMNLNTKKLGIALGRLGLEYKQGRARYKYYAMPKIKQGEGFLRDDMSGFERANYLDLKEIDEVKNL